MDSHERSLGWRKRAACGNAAISISVLERQASIYLPAIFGQIGLTALQTVRAEGEDPTTIEIGIRAAPRRRVRRLRRAAGLHLTHLPDDPIAPISALRGLPSNQEFDAHQSHRLRGLPPTPAW